MSFHALKIRVKNLLESTLCALIGNSKLNNHLKLSYHCPSMVGLMLPRYDNHNFFNNLSPGINPLTTCFARRPLLWSIGSIKPSPPSLFGRIKIDQATFATTLDPNEAPQIKLRPKRCNFNIIERENNQNDATYHIDAIKTEFATTTLPGKDKLVVSQYNNLFLTRNKRGVS